MDVNVKVVRFAVSTNNQSKGKERQGRGALFRNRKGKTMSGGEELFRLNAIRAFEALKQDGKKKDVLQLCRDNEIVKLSILTFFKTLWKDFDGDDVAVGLTRLHSTDTPPPAFVVLSNQSKKYLLSIARLCPDLLRQQDGSSIASEAGSVGTLHTVVPEFDTSEELAAMRVAMTAAYKVAETRGMDKDGFDAEARELFNGENYKKTFEFVVPKNFQAQSSNDGATAESHFDAILKAAYNAYSAWAKERPVGTYDRLVAKVFKKM